MDFIDLGSVNQSDRKSLHLILTLDSLHPRPLLLSAHLWHCFNLQSFPPSISPISVPSRFKKPVSHRIISASSKDCSTTLSIDTPLARSVTPLTLSSIVRTPISQS